MLKNLTFFFTNKIGQAIFWMLLSCFAISLLAALGRLTGQIGVNPFQTVFCRILFAFLILLPIILNKGLKSIKTLQLKFYILRALIGVIAMWSWFYAIALIPISDQTALSFLAPSFMTIGATIVFREAIKAHRYIAILFGFFGTLIILRPGILEVDVGHLVALLSALAMGCAMLIIKELTRYDETITILFISHLIMLPLALIPAIIFWEWHNHFVWLLLFFTGPLAVIGHFSLTKAFSLTDISFIAGIDYARLPFAVLFGWILFGEVSDIWTWIGASIIFLSSLHSIRREINLR